MTLLLPIPTFITTELLNLDELVFWLKTCQQQGAHVQETVGGAQGPAWSNHAELVVALLRLRMDPETCTLAEDLEVGLALSIWRTRSSFAVLLLHCTVQ